MQPADPDAPTGAGRRLNQEATAAAAGACRRLNRSHRVPRPTRLRILAHLQAGESCACEVQAALDVPANLLSHHLKVLREAGLVTGKRRGRWIDYRIEPTHVALLAAVLAAVAERPATACRATVHERTAAA